MDIRNYMLVAQQAENLVEDILEVQEVPDLEVPIYQDHVVLEREAHGHLAIDHIPEDDLHAVQAQEVLVLIDHAVSVHQRKSDVSVNPLLHVQDHSHQFELEHIQKK